MFFYLKLYDLLIDFKKKNWYNLNKENKKLRHEDFKPMTIDEFNSRIDQSMEDSKNDRLIDASELEAQIDKWN